jgi:hypothetical protein
MHFQLPPLPPSGPDPAAKSPVSRGSTPCRHSPTHFFFVGGGGRAQGCAWGGSGRLLPQLLPPLSMARTRSDIVAAAAQHVKYSYLVQYVSIFLSTALIRIHGVSMTYLYPRSIRYAIRTLLSYMCVVVYSSEPTCSKTACKCELVMSRGLGSLVWISNQCQHWR